MTETEKHHPSIFRNIAINQEGTITFEEIISNLKKIGHEKNNESFNLISKIFNNLDTEQKGRIKKSDFLTELNNSNESEICSLLYNELKTKHFSSKCEKIIHKLKLIIENPKINQDSKILQDLNWIVSTLSNEDIYQPDYVEQIQSTNENYQMFGLVPSIESNQRKMKDLQDVSNTVDKHKTRSFIALKKKRATLSAIKNQSYDQSIKNELLNLIEKENPGIISKNQNLSHKERISLRESILNRTNQFSFDASYYKKMNPKTSENLIMETSEDSNSEKDIDKSTPRKDSLNEHKILFEEEDSKTKSNKILANLSNKQNETKEVRESIFDPNFDLEYKDIQKTPKSTVSKKSAKSLKSLSSKQSKQSDSVKDSSFSKDKDTGNISTQNKTNKSKKVISFNFNQDINNNKEEENMQVDNKIINRLSIENSLKILSDEAKEILDIIDNSNFDIFSLDNLLKQKTLLFMTMEVFNEKNYFETGLLSAETFTNFIDEVTINGYSRKVAYHNDLHAADVFQTIFVFFSQGEFEDVSIIFNIRNST